MAESRSKLDSYLPAFLRRLVAVAGVARYVPAGASAASQMARRWLQDAGLEVDTSSKASAHELTTVMIWFVDDTVADQDIFLDDFVGGAVLCIHDASPCEQRRSRVAWEQAFITRGWRKHAALFELQNYNGLDFSSGSEIHLFERPPAVLLEEYPLQRLAAERDLHMDMTREPGRRSDAHMVRYSLASKFVRDGDRLLDAACGLGYGSWAMSVLTNAESIHGIDVSETAVEYARQAFPPDHAGNLVFSVSDAEQLGQLASNSVDFVVSVETLEHLHNPEKFLQQMYRVLNEGGRLFVSVPYDWSDETGEDPNPYHFHVYDWAKLERQLASAGFLLERAWLQDAGGGMKRSDCPRSITEFDPAGGPKDDGEWLLALAMKPLDWSRTGHGVSQHETRGTSAPSNILAFARDYQKPELVRALVAVGWRATSAALRQRLAKDAIAHAPPWSADYGAALCVLGYGLLETASPIEELHELMRAADAYRQSEARNPTCHRWQVSLVFLAARICLRLGDRQQALRRFADCAAMDPLLFSPLLATKTVGAAFQAGLLALSMGEREQALSLWCDAVRAVRSMLAGIDWKEVVGSDHAPLASFGLPELAEVVQLAGQCAAGIIQLRSRPGLSERFLDKIWQSPSSWLAAQADELQRTTSWSAELASRLQSIDREMGSKFDAMMAEIRLRDDSIRDLKTHIDDREQAIGWLQIQVDNHRDELNSAQESLSAVRAELAGRNEAVAWLERQLDDHRVELSRRDDAIAELGKYLTQVEGGREWLESQLTNHQRENAALADAFALQDETVRLQASEIDSLRGQLESARARLLALDGSFVVRIFRRLRLL